MHALLLIIFLKQPAPSWVEGRKGCVEGRENFKMVLWTGGENPLFYVASPEESTLVISHALDALHERL